MKNILVIGGAGYIGSHLVPMLIASGRQVTVLGRTISSNINLIDGVKYISGDFGNLELIQQLLEVHQEVIHLAFASVPNTSFENPLEDLFENLPPTLQLFSVAAAKSVKLIFVSSGGTIYGEAEELPISELHTKKPISPYGVTKLTLEMYAYFYGATHNLKYIIIRPSNVYGIGQRPFLGQGFISTAIASAIKGIPVNIYGEYGTIRDYLYISDLVSGILSVLNYGHLNEVYNIDSGSGLSNYEVLNNISSILGKGVNEIQIKHLKSRPFDVKVNVLNTNKLTEHTGWSPKIVFSEGLLATYKWINTLSI